MCLLKLSYFCLIFADDVQFNVQIQNLKCMPKDSIYLLEYTTGVQLKTLIAHNNAKSTKP